MPETSASGKGSYLLVLKLDEERDIRFGEKKQARFPAGYYCYTGSAMNGLGKRIRRHLSRSKKNHWHIDRFLDHARVIDVKSIESDKSIECELNHDVAGMADDTPVKGFGSSDCKVCRAHLHYFSGDPSGDLEALVKKWKNSSGITRKPGEK